MVESLLWINKGCRGGYRIDCFSLSLSHGIRKRVRGDQRILGTLWMQVLEGLSELVEDTKGKKLAILLTNKLETGTYEHQVYQ